MAGFEVDIAFKHYVIDVQHILEVDLSAHIIYNPTIFFGGLTV